MHKYTVAMYSEKSNKAKETRTANQNNKINKAFYDKVPVESSKVLPELYFFLDYDGKKDLLFSISLVWKYRKTRSTILIHILFSAYSFFEIPLKTSVRLTKRIQPIHRRLFLQNVKMRGKE